MTVSPPLAHIPDWGPSLTFVSKPGGYKYVTDQYAALLATTWNKKEKETRWDIQDRKDNVSWDKKDNYQNHKAYFDHEVDKISYNSKYPKYTYHRLGRQRDPKKRTEFIPNRTKPNKGQYSAIGKRTGVGRRTGIGGKISRKVNPVIVSKQKHRVEQGKAYPFGDSGWSNPVPPQNSYSKDPWMQDKQTTVYQPYQQIITGYALDPYAILALLGFLVFLFYIIYSFLNNTGNGRRSLDSDELSDLLSDNLNHVWSELKKK